MKHTTLFLRLGVLFALAMIMFLGGCATSIPLAKDPPLYSQEKLKAADHWDNIADTVAMRVMKAMEDRPDLVNKPVYVQMPNDRPFSIAFYNLLRTRMVSRGMQVSQYLEPDSLYLEYDVQTILYEDSRLDWVPSLKAMGIGIVNLVTGNYTTTSDHEIIINTRIAHNNRYVMHYSSIHYINDADWALYISPQSFDAMADRPRQVHLTDR